ncbi:MAG: Rv3235 family protein, partial [Nitriliruptoraceae bacterium]
MNATRRPGAPRPRNRRRPAPSQPDPDRLARCLVTIWLEVVAGRRPWPQLEPLTSPALRARLVAQLPSVPPAGHVPYARVRTSRTTMPSTIASESAVVVDYDGRCAAIAVRLERHRGAWRAVELTAPEAGLPALLTRSDPSTTTRRDAFVEVLESPVTLRD